MLTKANTVQKCFMAVVWFRMKFFAFKNQNKSHNLFAGKNRTSLSTDSCGSTLDEALVAQMYLVGLSHCVVRVMWFRYCILPEAVLLSSQLFHETTGVNRIRHCCLSLALMTIISFFKERQCGRLDKLKF